MSEVVAIIGASDKPQRYANKAMRMLRQHGHEVVLVNPYKQDIDGQRCYPSVLDYPGMVDTVSLYVNPKRFYEHVNDIIAAKPHRVIMNPGTEDADHVASLEAAGIEVHQACTLVLLSTGAF